MYFSEEFSPLAENVMTGGKENSNLVCEYTLFRSITARDHTTWQFTIPFGSNEQTLWNAV